MSSLAINRELKAAAIVLDRAFRSIGADPDRAVNRVRALDDAAWRDAAILAGKGPPSDQPRALVIATYEGRERFADQFEGVANG